MSLRERVRRAPAAQLLVRQYRRRVGRPRWKGVAGAPLRMPTQSTVSRVLMVTSVGGHLTGSTLESGLAAALALRGAVVETLLCDAALPACLECTTLRLGEGREMADHGPRRLLCPGCFSTGAATYGELGVPVHRYSDWLTARDRADAREVATTTTLEDLSTLRLHDVAVGEHALAGALRFFARADLTGEEHAEPVVRRYVEAAALTVYAVERLLAARAYDVAVFHHGIYVPQGLVGEVARARGVRVVNWNPAYRKNSFIFSHGDTYHHTLMDEPRATWDSIPWDGARERETMDYLRSRWSGAQDWIWFHDVPREDVAAIEEECGVDFSRPVVGLLTNVMWDAQLHYPANAFPDMITWITDTVRYFADRPELQLLIRVHPAEIRGTVPSRQLVVEELGRVFPQLPMNVSVLGPESNASTYVAMGQCDTVLIYGTKTGVELTAMGIPVIVAGEAWIRGKGLTTDAQTREEYREALDSLPRGERLDAATTAAARRYAYHFFFRRMIPLGILEPTGGDPVFRLTVRDLSELAPGSDPGLDCICDGILTGSPFVYRAEEQAGRTG